MKRPVWMYLSLFALLLVAVPAFGEMPGAQCSATETVEAVVVEEALFLDEGGGDPQCEQVSGCGFQPARIFGNMDDFCEVKCPPASCHPGYESGYWDASLGCCICVAI